MKFKVKMPSTKKSFIKKYSHVFTGFGLFAFLCLGLALVVLPIPAFSTTVGKTAEDKNLELREEKNQIILEKANEYYNRGNYLKAVDELNIAIEYHQDTKDLPSNIQLMAEASYYSWINSLYKNSKVLDFDDYGEVVTYLALHPEVISTRIEKLMDEVHNKEYEYYLGEIKNSQSKNKSSEKYDAKLKKIEGNIKLLKEVQVDPTRIKDVKRSIANEEARKKSLRTTYIMYSLYSLIFIAIVVLIIILYSNQKKSIEAQKQFETTMKVVALLRQNSDSEESPYNPSKTPEDDENEKNPAKARKRLGLTDYESEKIAVSYFDNEASKKDFILLQNKCIELGDKIDKATGRSRNSKKVSELVFKLCKAAGVDDELSLIYYCAAMVYDAGFLSISKNILKGEHLTIKERYEVRSHVQKAKEYYDFIPDGIRRIFLDAAEFHHENMDGKGYLAGLSGTKIPLIAKFIRVAESYTSLINLRSYRKSMDVDSALDELRKKNGMYDPKILNLLEKVI
ncbi:HD-GYP domain-containing protein [Treponema sp.]|uniref:HD-GYP domain-containing protein n=1 Tax=Treponema sp. TaxID=166 RepID=UPI00298E032A|nr:HD domain-containing phosphohydrolase [Treponema sp.]